MKKCITKKLLTGDNVEVRHFGEGVDGSWRPGVVIAEKKSSRQVKYNDLYCEDGITKLVEWIPVSAFVDGQFCSHPIPKDYRGHIRPSLPLSITHGQNLSYGVCVDAFVDDAWWEGVVFDRQEDSDQRLLFFPDLGDQQMVNINSLRITHDWDEVIGDWRARGHWLLLGLLEKFEQEEGSLPVSIRQIWYDVRSNYGFKNKVSAWTCGKKSLWDTFVMGAIQENIYASNGQSVDAMNLSAKKKLANISCKRRKIDKKQQVLGTGPSSISFATSIDLPQSLVNGDLESFFTLPPEINSLSLEAQRNNFEMPTADTDCSFDDREMSSPLPFGSLDETGSSKIQPESSYQGHCLIACNVNSAGERSGEYVDSEASIRGGSRRITSCTRASSGSLFSNKELVSKRSLARVGMEQFVEEEYCPQAVTDYIHEMRILKCTNPPGSLKSLQLKAKRHLSAIGWRFRYISKGNHTELRYFSPEGKHFISLHKACQWMEKEGMVPTASKGLPSHPHPDLTEKAKQDGVEASLNEETKHYREEVTDLWVRKQKYVLGRLKKKKGEASHFILNRCVESNRRYQPRMLHHRKGELLQALPSGPGQHKARTILSWLIERDVVLPRQQVSYFHRKTRRAMAVGRITHEGIKCKCCDKVYSLANFEVHAGSANRCPAAHIFLEDGRSLLDCQMQSLQDASFVGPSTSQPYKRRKISYSQYKNDSVCSVCHYGGTLVLCDSCPSSFHPSCINLKDLPEGKWFCPSCQCAICGQSGFNGDTDQFMDMTVLFCDQCEREYHVGCLKKRGLPGLESCPQGDWFCSKECAEIFRCLNRLVGRSNLIDVEGLSWTIVKSKKEDSGLGLSNAEAVTELHCKLCVALGILHECFVPIIDPSTKSDLVADVLFNKGSDLNRLNFRGFYTMLLEKGDELISVATVRIYGEKVAEMPLVATRFQFRRQGMCRLLINELEKMLSALGIERLILPAVPALVKTWTTSFGFTKMTHLERSNLLGFTFLDFQDTTMCQKILKKLKGSSGESQLIDGIRKISKMDCDGNNIDSVVMQVARASDDVLTYSLHGQKVVKGDTNHLFNPSNSLNGYHGLDSTLEETKLIGQHEIKEGISEVYAQSASSSSSNAYHNFHLSRVQESRYSEQNEPTKELTVDIAAGEDRGHVSSRYLNIGESVDKKFNGRIGDTFSYDSFKHFYTRRRILGNKYLSAQTLGIL